MKGNPHGHQLERCWDSGAGKLVTRRHETEKGVATTLGQAAKKKPGNLGWRRNRAPCGSEGQEPGLEGSVEARPDHDERCQLAMEPLQSSLKGNMARGAKSE